MSIMMLSPEAQARAAEERHFWTELSAEGGSRGVEGRILLAAGDALRNAIIQELKPGLTQYTIIEGVGHALGSILVTLAANLSNPASGMPKGIVLGGVLGDVIGGRIEFLLAENNKEGGKRTLLYEVDGQLTDRPGGTAS
ncbi:hypothetical protein GGQ86_000396 [Xanthobacter flavus]|uniref:Uncharacterized protein n=1 Tax=Xanthobacter flavus TaxID=281 RepID=A0A9W6CSP7_XANFL|nr:hypothetical protein [Xanthobacter flavus]MDR6331949.1 hypothetical protein [Xanthobacter flavus]GLI25617.1 hypothetical protein XFLAVUS301_52910 [Xanthobacter flavus]